MHSNRFWLGFLAFFACILVGYSTITLYHVYIYWRLNAHTAPTAIEWHAKEIDEDLFAATAVYTFHVNGNTFMSNDYVRKPTYQNRWAAESELASHAKQYKQVWYRSSDPTYSSIQKIFPTKECIYMCILVGLFLYFLWLGFYVGGYRIGNNLIEKG